MPIKSEAQRAWLQTHKPEVLKKMEAEGSKPQQEPPKDKTVFHSILWGNASSPQRRMPR